MKKIFWGSLLISIWIVILFWGKNIGLSMLLLVVPFLYFLISLLESKNKIKYKEPKILIIPIILLSSTYFIFDNSFFNSLNLIVISGLIIFMIIRFMEDKLNIDKLFLRFIELILDPLTRIELTMNKIKLYITSNFKFIKKDNKENNILKGILITIPFVIIIIVLIASADDVFSNIFSQIFNSIFQVLGKFKLTTIIFKLITIIALFMYFSCFFHNLIFEYEVINEDIAKTEIKDKTTIKILLSALNIIYILFCFIQIRSLFMGKNDVSNYSQYARKGFFQLMIVSVINLAVILFAKKVEKNKYINLMCLLMVICTFIILLSSAYRMYLYESAYGYTRLRLLVYVALLTEAILLIPTIIYIMDKKINLSQVYISIIIVMYVGINFSNVDNIITKSNVNRYFEIGVFDVEYLKKETGYDAIKELIRIRDSEAKMQEEEDVKYKIDIYLSEMYEKLEKEEMDFRNLNLSKLIAKKMY